MNEIKDRLTAGLVVAAATILVACTGGPGSTAAPGTALPSPTSTGSVATPAPGTTGAPQATPDPVSVTSAAQAAALVFSSDPRWAQMMPLRSDMIGQSTWYEASESGDGFAVSITVGQGDCMAGCIDKHVWQYTVDDQGNVELTGEDGEAIEVTPGTGGEGDVNVAVQLTAGPTCPVEQVPPDPDCAARAVANATVTIFDPHGNEVGTTTSNGDGMAAFSVPPGAYYVVPAPADGLMGVAEAQAFSALGGDHVSLLFAYDTGIR
jgi:hypothetical protein